MKVGVLFSTSTGNCETVGGYIVQAAKAAGLDVDDLKEVSEAREIEKYSGLIVGAPTWNTGADSERSGTSWDEWLYSDLPSLNLKDKKVAVFGVGDQISYGDNFCDAAGELYDQFLKAGCKMLGFTSTDGYDHDDSKALLPDGRFCGLMLDEDNQSEESEGRANKWIEQLKGEGLFA
ncbi:unnamed protein product [Vitrella brassicaformis CCMP3155]|uniref:Flavodoxin-like domain-containing protein n=1 Tax=Vitrella brassicaformis (strain CCMP3155) TaxID=1169540 RepID=A0A0G4EU79_VITBC|nr:unnamed protein product [Vitrella brassicaformis CCMP3155]|eukprot:CEM02203.1 unnamed protein product [Vitrella brassicaformis CCMP3155]